MQYNASLAESELMRKVFEKQGCEKGFKQKTDNEKQAVFELAPKTQILEG